MRYNVDYQNQKVKEIFKPGACLVSCGRRGGGKTHCAMSFAQKLVQGEFPDMPGHVVLLSNVIFVRKGENGISEAYPDNVHKVTTIKEYFPIVADMLERYDRKDVLILLVLDEAQNFLLGDLNSSGDLARSFKTFAGLLRKWNTVAWFITPAMRNLTPAFRNFLDSDTDAGNVTCTFEKDVRRSQAYLDRKHMNLDARDIVYVKQGSHEPEKMLIVPPSTWTRDPETIRVGEYAYDTYSSADFRIGEGFPFYDFVYHVSGKSSYDMVASIREFYQKMEREAGEEGPVDRERIEKELQLQLMRNAMLNKIKGDILEQIFGCDKNRVNYLKALTRARYPEVREAKNKGENGSTKNGQASTSVEG